MTTGLLTFTIFFFFQNNTPLTQLILIDLELAFGTVFTKVF